MAANAGLACCCLWRPGAAAWSAVLPSPRIPGFAQPTIATLQGQKSIQVDPRPFQLVIPILTADVCMVPLTGRPPMPLSASQTRCIYALISVSSGACFVRGFIPAICRPSLVSLCLLMSRVYFHFLHFAKRLCHFRLVPCVPSLAYMHHSPANWGDLHASVYRRLIGLT